MSKSIRNRDAFSRINFLYQAAYNVLLKSPTNVSVARFYISSLRTIARKNVLRLDPTIKRNLCRKCFMVLIPGVTAKVRMKSKRQPHTVVTCLECQCQKRFVINDRHKLWSESVQAWQLLPSGVSNSHSTADSSTSGSNPTSGITTTCMSSTKITSHDDPALNQAAGIQFGQTTTGNELCAKNNSNSADCVQIHEKIPVTKHLANEKGESTNNEVGVTNGDKKRELPLATVKQIPHFSTSVQNEKECCG